jgi:hypothetical protein
MVTSKMSALHLFMLAEMLIYNLIDRIATTGCD